MALPTLSKFIPEEFRGIGGAVIGQFEAIKQAQLAYMWELKFSTPTDGSVDAGEIAKFYAIQTAIPTTIMEPIRRTHAGVSYTVISRDVSPKVFRASFWDNQNMECFRFFENWRLQASGLHAGYQVKPKDYMRDIELLLKDTTDFIVSEKFKFIDCYPIEISETALTYSESQYIMFDVMFAFRFKDMDY